MSLAIERTATWRSCLIAWAGILAACHGGAAAVAGTPAPAGPVFSEAEVDVPAHLIHMPSPKCPEAARGMREDGKVVLEYVIGSDGRAEPGSIHVVRSNHYLFEQPAVQAVLKARFCPARRHGEAVRVKNEQRFTFVMEKS